MTPITDEEVTVIKGLCHAHLRDHESPPQTGVAVDEESAEQLRSILQKL